MYLNKTNSIYYIYNVFKYIFVICFSLLINCCFFFFIKALESEGKITGEYLFTENKLKSKISSGHLSSKCL